MSNAKFNLLLSDFMIKTKMQCLMLVQT